MKSWIKAGLIGAVLEIVFTIPALLIYLAPGVIGNSVTICSSGLYYLVLPVVGILTVIFSDKPATTRDVVRLSAFAGLLASAIDGVFTVGLTTIISASGMMIGYFEKNSPEILRLASTNELLHFYLSPSGQAIFTSICSVINILIAIGLSVVGAVIYNGITQRRSEQNNQP
jgi:hypothetical protein